MFHLRLCIAVIPGLGSFMPQTLHAQDAGYTAQAAALVESYVKSDLFCGVVLAAQDGRPLFRQAFGAANREWHIQNSLDTKFRIGSVTKQFTAAAILQLAEQGKLKLDDPIAQYYPGAPAAWDKVTIKNLLTHTSGIPPYTALPDFFKNGSRIDRTPREIIELTQDKPLGFEPGTQFAYDNTGYVLLGYVIEKCSGQSYAQYLRAHIFEPLGMHATGYDDGAAILPERAAGYVHMDDAWKNAPYIAMSLPFAAGGLYSTADDLLIWNEALSAGKVIDAASLQATFTDYGHHYGFGWFINRQFDRSSVSHGGAINGFRSIIDRYPDDRLVIVVLANSATAPVEQIAHQLAALRFGVSEQHAEIAVDPKLFDLYAGRYQIAPNFILTISREGDRLFSQATGQQKVELFAKSGREYFLKVIDAQLTFIVNDSGRATAVILHQNGHDIEAPHVE